MIQPAQTSSTGRTRALLCVAGAVLLGQVVTIGQSISTHQRNFTWIAPALVFGVLTLVIASLLIRKISVPTVAVQTVMVTGILMGLCRLPLLDLYWTFPNARARLLPFVLCAAICSALIFTIVTAKTVSLARACFAILLVTYALMGIWYLQFSGSPRIDVFVVQTFGCHALTAGTDPYAISFPNPYEPDASFFPPGLVVNGLVHCGYCYPPVSLIGAMPGYWAGDVRLSQLGALLLSAALLGFCLPRRSGLLPAVMLLFSPGIFYLLENAWIEPLLVLLIAVTAIGFRRGWRITPVALCLFLAAKQYAPLAAPAALLLLPRPWQWRSALRWSGPGIAAAAVVTAPFFLWNPHEFVRSLTVLNVAMVRHDSISFVPALIDRFHLHWSLIDTAICALPAMMLVLWKAPRDAGGFAAGVALILLCVFVSSPLSFGNYYFLAIGALCIAAAVDSPATPGENKIAI